MTSLLTDKVLIEDLILDIRGQKVMLDADLAVLYGTTTKALNQAVKRNLQRFPLDFMFKLTTQEKEEVTNCDLLRQVKFSNTLPYVFTEYGTLMQTDARCRHCEECVARRGNPLLAKYWIATSHSLSAPRDDDHKKVGFQT